jgi:hypothetical protein
MFALSVEFLSTDPRANQPGSILLDVAGMRYDRVDARTARAPDGRLVLIANLDLVQQGHHVRVFQALDARGDPIPDTYVLAQERQSGVFDHQDNLILVQGVAPVGFGRSLSVSGLDAAAVDAGLAFSRFDAPDASPSVLALGGQTVRDSATLTLRNDGFLPVSIASVAVEGPGARGFSVVGAPSTLAPGAAAAVTVRFTGGDPGLDGAATLYGARLVIRSDAFPATEAAIRLSGVAMEKPVPAEAPTLAEIAASFGYRIEAPRGAGDGAVTAAAGDEISAPYLRALDPGRPVEIAPLAAFGELGLAMRLGWHAVDDGRSAMLLAFDDQQGQTLAPGALLAGPGEAGRPRWTAFEPGGGFGLRLTVDGRPGAAVWSDPRANDLDPVNGLGVAPGFGQAFRFFAARDADGDPIEGLLIGAADQGGGGFDYNDAVFALRNAAPHAFTPGEDRNRDGVNDALRRDPDLDGLPAFFDWPPLG